MRYEKLKAWQCCHRLAIEVYRVSKSFPSEERHGITAQLLLGAHSSS